MRKMFICVLSFLLISVFYSPAFCSAESAYPSADIPVCQGTKVLLELRAADSVLISGVTMLANAVQNSKQKPDKKVAASDFSDLRDLFSGVKDAHILYTSMPKDKTMAQTADFYVSGLNLSSGWTLLFSSDVPEYTARAFQRDSKDGLIGILVSKDKVVVLRMEGPFDLAKFYQVAGKYGRTLLDGMRKHEELNLSDK